ncbi:MAG: hypothetical protein ACOH2E_08760 [Candidatus Paracaedibacter sp.]
MINDAVHGVMSFPEKYKGLLKALIDSETFQSLRHIKQLGMTDLIFPTAVHNRFSHCLGAARAARERLKKLLGLNLIVEIGTGPFDPNKKYMISP